MLHLRFGGFLFPYNRNAAAEQIGMTHPWDGYPMFLPRWSAGPLSVRHPFPCEDSQKMWGRPPSAVRAPQVAFALEMTKT